ncbi:hypothetical protein [Microbacterium sp. USHLN186]|uniref:hypothetical protein n=1 Tax=Microbacterium sp. USHLN186 TaxID=3081286 RepID=UPI003015D1AD
MHDVFIHPSGQDDNLGDSALRAGLLRAVGRNTYRFHVHLEGQTSDYLAGIPLSGSDVVYETQREWATALSETARPIYLLNAGEVNPRPGHSFPGAGRIREMRRTRDRDGVVIAAGIGLKTPSTADSVDFDRTLRETDVMSWRDDVSRDAAGFGDSAPDWAFHLGSQPSAWAPPDERTLLAVTLRFDRPWPGDPWLTAVRDVASRTGTRVATVAQVARDAPRAVQLADALGGEYLVAASTRHDDLDSHVRSVYSRSLAVVSDRAHALIMGATEGAYPLGSATDPNKIRRLLDIAGVGSLTGDHANFGPRAAGLDSELPALPRAIDSARLQLQALTQRIQTAIEAHDA